MLPTRLKAPPEASVGEGGDRPERQLGESIEMLSSVAEGYWSDRRQREELREMCDRHTCPDPGIHQESIGGIPQMPPLERQGISRDRILPPDALSVLKVVPGLPVWVDPE